MGVEVIHVNVLVYNLISNQNAKGSSANPIDSRWLVAPLLKRMGDHRKNLATERDLYFHLVPAKKRNSSYSGWPATLNKLLGFDGITEPLNRIFRCGSPSQ
jgi:hypothetical protein